MKLYVFVSLRRLCHPKLVQLYGVCLQQRPLLIVAEFMENGCLLNFLRQRGRTLKEAWLLSMCQDICEGMEYLEANSFIHRDLVSHNMCVMKLPQDTYLTLTCDYIQLVLSYILQCFTSESFSYDHICSSIAVKSVKVKHNK